MPKVHELSDEELRKKLARGELSGKKSPHCACRPSQATTRAYSRMAQAAFLVGSDTRRDWFSWYFCCQSARCVRISSDFEGSLQRRRVLFLG